MGLGDVVRGGDRLASLEALRDRLADELEKCDSKRDIAALAQRLTDVLDKIDEIPTTKQGSAADEIAERRAARGRGSAAVKARAPRSS
jgi:hypothetical protein